MNKKNSLALVVFIFLVIFVVLFYSFISFFTFKEKKLIEGYPRDYYNRKSPEYSLFLKEKNDSIEVYSLNFKSKDFLDEPAIIHGILFIPSNKKNIPGIVFLPGGGVKKESLTERAFEIASLDYAVLVIDQRGIGETGGPYPSIEQDYEIFSSSGNSIQHLGVYDALVASDVLRKINQVDKNKIAIIGESMGGRYAIIATAIDKKLNGVIAISSSGFHIQNNSQPYTPYLLSIDPDSYIGKISPRPVFMLQGDVDDITNIEDARYTFSLANEPKSFFVAQGCGHGYCDKMSEEFKKLLGELFNKHY